MQDDLIIRNARLKCRQSDDITVVDCAILAGRIRAIGPRAMVDDALTSVRVSPSTPFSGDAKPELDADGRFIAAGFVDAHVHATLAGTMLNDLDLSGATSQREFEELIAQRHDALPAGEWLIARGWSETRLGGRTPDLTWLRAAGDRPCVAHRVDIHAVVVNDPVIRAANTAADLSFDPPGGRIGRDAHGHCDGRFTEAAAWHIINPLIPEATTPIVQKAYRNAIHAMHAAGITAAGTMEYLDVVASAIAPIAHDQAFRMRIISLDRTWPLDFERLIKIASELDGEHAAIIGCKAFIDGTLGSRTAAMLSPYVDGSETNGGPGDGCGLLVELAADGHLNDWACAVRSHGLCPVMHAIGNRAVRLALDAADACETFFENSRETAQGNAGIPTRIEHAEFIHDHDIPRFRGRIASMQPLHRHDDAADMTRAIGPDAPATAFPFDRLRGAGAIIAGGSDWPVVTCDPIAGMRAAVHPTDGDGQLIPGAPVMSAREAVAAWTTGAGASIGLRTAGVLQAGEHGDVILLDHDVESVVRDVSIDGGISTTIVGGTVVHDTASVHAENHRR